MEKAKINDHFTRFPYRKEIHADGGVNNGGIDLVDEPNRIEEIHEIKDWPWLRRLVEEVNLKHGHFMTFGCDFGEDDGYFAGYIEFSHRPNMRQPTTEDLRILDEYFYEWISALYSDDKSEPHPIEYCRRSLAWEYTPLEYKGTYEKVSVWFRVTEPQGAEWLINHLRHFLVEIYPSFPHIKKPT
ncbi:hypothetical protein [Enterobacter hormaechei]|uniref:hypothetical protein n=1 Tax=Enterobacter hormaechei TaxID=158836 RepID=UPI000755FAA5|nr:hypothetical protein [Enterobacter hormaechei]KVJ63718.1 hypothetical protein AWS29_20510 [Enterobacter hormaechei subsp. steigerwaltii]HAS0793973.1 hypothetical protein [Enterobacter hormaechei subsp. steigerwaltii]